MVLTWIEKYRPTQLNDYINNSSDVIGFIRNKLDTGNPLPHLILYSMSPGTGKTSLIKTLATEYNADTLYLNASGDRGIDVIRGEVKRFVKSAGFNKNMRFVLFDEADGLTPEAFDSLRNLMESVDEHVKFIFSCNNVNKITEPIMDRCKSIDMSAPNREEIFVKLTHIASIEGMDILPEQIYEIINQNYPSVRSMVKDLEDYCATGKMNESTDLVEELYDVICGRSNRDALKMVYDRTLNHRALLLMLFDKFIMDEDYSFVEAFAEADYKMSIGSTPEVTMVALIQQLLER